MGHIIHAAKRRKGWKRKFESVQRGRIRPLQKKKKDIGLLFQRFSSKLVVFVSARVLD